MSDNYGMSPQEAAYRQALMAKLMSTGDPTNQSVAELMSHGPLQISNPQTPPSDAWSGGPRNGPQMVPGGAGDSGGFAPQAPPSAMSSPSYPGSSSYQRPPMAPQAPPAPPQYSPSGYGSGMGSSMGGYPPSTSGPISSQPSAMSNSSYPGSPSYQQPTQGHTININIGGNPASNYPTDGNVTPNWTEQQYQSQQPRPTQGPSSYSGRPDVMGGMFGYGPQAGITPPTMGPPAGLGGLFPGSQMTPYTPTSPDLNRMYQQGAGSMPPIGPVQQPASMYPTPGPSAPQASMGPMPRTIPSQGPNYADPYYWLHMLTPGQ